MIKPVDGDEYAKVFASIYNSANTLFPENARCDAGEEIFYRQLTEDHNFVYIKKDDVCGFVSYHRFAEYYEITSLYVKRDCQRMKIGHHLLSFAESQIEKDCYIIIKVLKNADWAVRFYQEHGYKPLSEARDLAQAFNLTEKMWEKILYKICDDKDDGRAANFFKS